MTIKLNPYINFDGNTREAMQFYHSVLGGQLQLSTFKDFNAASDPRQNDRIMHAQLETPNGMTLMAADTMVDAPAQPGTNFNISLSGEDEASLRSYYEKLSAGGRVVYPLEKAPWGDQFGMLTDRFGVMWIVNITAPKS